MEGSASQPFRAAVLAEGKVLLHELLWSKGSLESFGLGFKVEGLGFRRLESFSLVWGLGFKV